MKKFLRSIQPLGLAIAWAAALPFAASAQDTKPLSVPLEAIASLPTFDKAKLSPDGNTIAYLSGQEIAVRDLSATKVRKVASPEGHAIASLQWANNQTILFTIRHIQQDLGLDSMVVETKVFALDINSMKAKWIGRPRDLSKNKWNRHIVHRDRIVDLLPDEPEHVLLQLKHKLTEGPSVYRVNIKTAVQKLEIGPHPAIAIWYSAPDGEIRAGGGFARRAQRTWQQLSRVKRTDGKWISLKASKWRAEYDFEALSDDPNDIFISGKTEFGTKGLFRTRLGDGETLETVFAHPQFDMKGLLRNPGTGRTEGIFYVDDMPRQIFFDPRLQDIQAAVQRLLPNRRLWLEVPFSPTGKLLVRIYEETQPGSYFIFDPANNILTALSPRIEAFPHTATNSASLSNRVSIPVADGTILPGYLTQPDHSTGPIPMIVLPPDIPGTRASAEWYYLRQFLVSRGYAVLEPNHRGARGFGAEFEDAGKSQFGGLMTRDVIEATRWAIEQGHADPDRICIMGQGFAGYRALMASIEAADLFRCAIAVNAVADLPRFKANNRFYLEGTRNWTRDVQLTGVEDKAISPFHRANDLNLPVLLIASADNARVPYRMSRALYKKLKKHRDDARYIKISNGGHTLFAPRARVILLQETESFLKKHLPPTG